MRKNAKRMLPDKMRCRVLWNTARGYMPVKGGGTTGSRTKIFRRTVYEEKGDAINHALAKKGGELMHIISLFELLLVALAFYAAVNFEGTMRLAVVLLCLLTVFLVERLDKRVQEDEELRERLQRYKIEGRKKKLQVKKTEQPIYKDSNGVIKKA